MKSWPSRSTRPPKPDRLWLSVAPLSPPHWALNMPEIDELHVGLKNRGIVASQQARLRDMLKPNTAIPVVVLNEVEHAVPVAEALAEGGLSVIEFTLRTPNAIAVLEAMAAISGLVVGAGTLLSANHVSMAVSAGAAFGVSPGSTSELLLICKDSDLPLLAGSDSASVSMELADQGYTFQKFFPAEASGGISKLGAFAKPLPHIEFCPTGGIAPEILADYLALMPKKIPSYTQRDNVELNSGQRIFILDSRTSFPLL